MKFLQRMIVWTCIVFFSVCNVRTQQEDSECVPYYLCENGTLITDGRDLVVLKSGMRKSCENRLEVWCKIPSAVRNRPSASLDPTRKAKGIDIEIPSRGCGVRRKQRITHSSSIQYEDPRTTFFAELPWMVTLLEQTESTPKDIIYKHKCGASLFHPQVVVTAAHCVTGVEKNTLTVRGGEWDMKSEKEPLPHQDRSVQQIIVHPDYNAGNLHNDIAVIVVESPFHLTDNVDIICPPLLNMNFDEERCIVSGWGKDPESNRGTYAQTLRKIDVSIVPNDQCEERFRKTRLGKYFILDKSFICTGGENDKDSTCQGDGGSPLVCSLPQDPTRWAQVGIVSWGLECGKKNPTVHTKVSDYVEWIISQIPWSDSQSDVLPF